MQGKLIRKSFKHVYCRSPTQVWYMCYSIIYVFEVNVPRYCRFPHFIHAVGLQFVSHWLLFKQTFSGVGGYPHSVCHHMAHGSRVVLE